jgi:hypothetical protein
MPSPRGSNREHMYLPAEFPRTTGAAYDALGESSMPPGFMSRACKWLRQNGFDADDLVEFVAYMDGAGEVEAEDDHGPTESQHNAMELAAGGHHPNQQQTVTRDRLPPYGANGMPKNNIRAQDEALKFARRIKHGPIGY